MHEKRLLSRRRSSISLPRRVYPSSHLAYCHRNDHFQSSSATVGDCAFVSSAKALFVSASTCSTAAWFRRKISGYPLFLSLKKIILICAGMPSEISSNLFSFEAYLAFQSILSACSRVVPLAIGRINTWPTY